MFDYEYEEYHYKIDKVNSEILRLLSVKPRRLASLQHHIGQLTPFAVLHRMNKLEATGLVVAERIPHTSTTYHLAPAKEGKGKEMGDVDASPEEKHTGENHVRSTP